MKKIAFHTFITDENVVRLGAFKMIQSFKHFHPDIPLIIFNSKHLAEQCIKYNQDLRFCNPLICKLLEDKYETIVHIDSDMIVVDRFDEILECNYDVAIVRNNSDYNTAGSGPGLTAKGSVNINEYANCGLYAIKNRQILNDWIELNKKIGQEFSHFEQDTFNICIRNIPNLNIKLLDPIESNLYYGTANLYGKARHNESWKDVVVKDGKFYLNNKLIKAFHDAGGGSYRLDIDHLFSSEVAKHIKELCYII